MIKNLLTTLKRFKLSSILNILGLTIAFAAFAVIMMQVRYDLGYDRFHPDVERIYRVDGTMEGIDYGSFLPRPTGRKIIEISPYIEKGGVYYCWGDLGKYRKSSDPTNRVYEEKYGSIEPEFADVMGFDFIEGSAKGLVELDKIIIPESIARRLFPDKKSFVGEILLVGEGNTERVICGVYKDIPKNSFVHNAIYKNIGEYDLNNESEWSYHHYVKLTDASHKEAVEKLMNDWGKEKYSMYKSFSFRLLPIGDAYFDTLSKAGEKGSMPTTLVLLGVAIMILVIAAINFLNFAMATTPMRIKSINMRKILGSTVGKLRLYMIFESVIIALIAFGLSLLVVHYLSTSSFAGFLTAKMGLTANLYLMVFTGLVALVTGVAAGIIPAFYSTSFAPMLVLKGSFGMSPSGKRFRAILVGFQYVVSIGLIIVSLIMVLQNNFMKDHPVGFNRSNVLMTYLSGDVNTKRDSFIAELRSNPIIKDIAFSRDKIIDAGHMRWGRTFKEENIQFMSFPTTPNFVKFMDMEIVDGRDFMEEDLLKDFGVFIFNQKAAQMYGLKIGDKLEGHSDAGPAEVVGIVKDFNFQPMQYPIGPMALYVFGTDPWWSMNLMYVRINEADTRQAIQFIRKTMMEFDPKYTDVEVTFLDEFTGKLYEKEESLATLISIFGIVAMIISLVGVFGLVIFETQYRRKEIGLRKINGATIRDILVMFNTKFVWLIAICFVVAAPVAWYGVNKWLESFAYKTPIHWWVFAVALLVVLIVTVTTVTVQSWKAATENPVNSLKSD